MEVAEVVALIPVLNRPEHVAPLVASWRASQTPGRLLFVANASDSEELDAIVEAKASVLVVDDHRITWPQKINDGYRATDEPWILCGADDIHFHPGWFEATEILRINKGVIGTNDLGNPRVMRGDHTTHPLIARWYGDYCGTADGEKRLVHEGYRHWYVDDELVETAKFRGKWAFCPDAQVEHLHPYWNKGEWDETYELGTQAARQDRYHYLERRHLWV